ncbi:hypothetical protein ACFV1L_19675 [Kitasatospora sp. NPDC059646]|uniref:hypothetical protein n=1 Tax=Kitasatospora sp. NPDC059646 TaxID=3346893 RepID=UPI00369FDEB3
MAAAFPIRRDSRRLPLVAVDHVEAVEGGFTGRKRVTADDPYLAGHFPSLTVYPGVFLIESLQQMLELHLDGALGGVELVRIDSARFSSPALAGDDVRFDVTLTDDGTHLTTRADCSTGGRRCARINATWRHRT